MIDGFAQVLGVVEGGPSPGLLLPRIPAHYTSLGGPPSFQSITRYSIFAYVGNVSTGCRIGLVRVFFTRKPHASVELDFLCIAARLPVCV